ncbi:hypothetical protein P167DRAFT_58173 [Morchella conica CCBAS932]|uniref:Uncharacterized protein n=1 Tax=Morchella conica CCBAS932 TaxID=1392247 RepID=A0A3N4KVM7_9PEZI|nr:hypothetical protein P167DRAFT_58173 [Morchella conica CCBAS932]
MEILKCYQYQLRKPTFKLPENPKLLERSLSRAPRGGRTRNLEIPLKSLTLYRLS